MRYLWLIALPLLVTSDLDARVLFSSAGGPPKSIAFVAFGSGTESTGSALTTYTMAYTSSAATTNEMLIFMFHTASGTGTTPAAAATYNSLTCSTIAETPGKTNGFLDMFACPIGTGDGVSHNFVATMVSGANITNAIAYVGEYSGVLQSSYNDASNSGSSPSPISTSVTPIAIGDWIVAVEQNGISTPTVACSPFTHTERFNADVGSFGAGTFEDSGGTVTTVLQTCTWTVSGANVGDVMMAMKHG